MAPRACLEDINNVVPITTRYHWRRYMISASTGRFKRGERCVVVPSLNTYEGISWPPPGANLNRRDRSNSQRPKKRRRRLFPLSNSQPGDERVYIGTNTRTVSTHLVELGLGDEVG